MLGSTASRTFNLQEEEPGWHNSYFIACVWMCCLCSGRPELTSKSEAQDEGRQRSEGPTAVETAQKGLPRHTVPRGEGRPSGLCVCPAPGPGALPCSAGSAASTAPPPNLASLRLTASEPGGISCSHLSRCENPWEVPAALKGPYFYSFF